jgi:hypothetical protein
LRHRGHIVQFVDRVGHRIRCRHRGNVGHLQLATVEAVLQAREPGQVVSQLPPNALATAASSPRPRNGQHTWSPADRPVGAGSTHRSPTAPAMSAMCSSRSAPPTVLPRVAAPSCTPRTAHSTPAVQRCPPAEHPQGLPARTRRLQCPPVGDPVGARAPAPPPRPIHDVRRRDRLGGRSGDRAAAVDRRPAPPLPAGEPPRGGPLQGSRPVAGGDRKLVLAVACSAASRRFGAYLAR